MRFNQSNVRNAVLGVFAGLLLARALAPHWGLAEERSAKFNRVLKLGAPAPEWRELPETDGGSSSLADLRKQQAVILFFTRNHCPVSKKYAGRINALSREFQSRGVSFVAVNVSRKSGEDLAAMKKVHEEQEWGFPYAKDETGKLADLYGATVTPQFFLLGNATEAGTRRVLYMGAFDDHPDEAKVQEKYLRLALEEVLGGKEVGIPESLAIGCEIEADDKPAP